MYFKNRLNPRVDIAFKKIFGVEENKDLLISLINSVVSKRDYVKELTLLNPYNPSNFKNDKLSILDIKALGEDGRRFNVEIQITDEGDYDKRALYYWAKLYTEQLHASGGYQSLNKAIGIHILNFDCISGNNRVHNCFHVTEDESGERYFCDFELHTIELKKFDSELIEGLTELVAKIHTALDMWVAFLTRHDLLNSDDLPKKLNNKALAKALKVMDHMNLTDIERDEYEAHLKWLRAETSAVEKAEERGERRGTKIGIEKGEKIGIEKGEKIGIEKGEKIGIEKFTKLIVKRMLLQGKSFHEIEDLTKLTHQQIEVIQAQAEIF